MKTKTLAQVDGFIGIIAGAILAFLPIFMVFLAAISEDEDAADNRISLAPSILFIVGSVVALIPFLGWIGGIVLVIGGALYLASLKQFRIEE